MYTPPAGAGAGAGPCRADARAGGGAGRGGGRGGECAGSRAPPPGSGARMEAVDELSLRPCAASAFLRPFRLCYRQVSAAAPGPRSHALRGVCVYVCVRVRVVCSAAHTLTGTRPLIARCRRGSRVAP